MWVQGFISFWREAESFFFIGMGCVLAGKALFSKKTNKPRLQRKNHQSISFNGRGRNGFEKRGGTSLPADKTDSRGAGTQPGKRGKRGKEGGGEGRGGEPH